MSEDRLPRSLRLSWDSWDKADEIAKGRRPQQTRTQVIEKLIIDGHRDFKRGYTVKESKDG